MPSRPATLGPALALFALAAFAGPSLAAPAASDSGTQQLVADHGWTALAYSEKGGKVCYLVGTPEKSEPANLSRGRIDLYITHRPGEKALNVVHFDAGYPYKQGSSADLDVDGKKFSLFTDKESAWAADSATDKAVTEALAKGKHASLKGSSQRGTGTTDTYALVGFDKALAAIDKACGVKR
ncbi:MAG TPA: invasion associated locus B family protein [Stellaceae bacterium]|nr:invasion associated locus B family protein [Stellaceae bacterium]